MENQKKSMTSISDLLKKSWKVYKNIFWPAIKMHLLGVLSVAPLVFILILYAFVAVLLSGEHVWMNIFNIIFAILAFLAVIFLVIAMYIAQIGTFIIVQKNDPNLKTLEVFKEAKTKASSFFSTSLLAGIIVLLWFLAFIIPGIIFSIYYTFVTWIILKEKLFGMSALKRSKYLIKDYWWEVFGRLLLLNVIVWIIFSIPASFIEEGSFGEIIYNIFSQILSVFITPFSLAYSYYMYKSLVKIKDGDVKNTGHEIKDDKK